MNLFEADPWALREKQRSDEAAARAGVRFKLERAAERLPLADAGPCDDCGEAGPRRRYLKLALCLACARPRLKAVAEHDPGLFLELIGQAS